MSQVLKGLKLNILRRQFQKKKIILNSHLNFNFLSQKYPHIIIRL